jgi:hypothetical protein
MTKGEARRESGDDNLWQDLGGRFIEILRFFSLLPLPTNI